MGLARGWSCSWSHQSSLPHSVLGFGKGQCSMAPGVEQGGRLQPACRWRQGTTQSVFTSEVITAESILEAYDRGDSGFCPKKSEGHAGRGLFPQWRPPLASLQPPDFEARIRSPHWALCGCHPGRMPDAAARVRPCNGTARCLPGQAPSLPAKPPPPEILQRSVARFPCQGGFPGPDLQGRWRNWSPKPMLVCLYLFKTRQFKTFLRMAVTIFEDGQGVRLIFLTIVMDYSTTSAVFSVRYHPHNLGSC